MYLSVNSAQKMAACYSLQTSQGWTGGRKGWLSSWLKVCSLPLMQQHELRAFITCASHDFSFCLLFDVTV